MGPVASSSPLEDGSTAYYDGAGNLTQIITRDGTVVAADTSIVSDFLRQVGGGLGGAIKRAFSGDTGAGGARVTQAPSGTPASALNIGGITISPQMRNVLLIVAAVFIAKKFFA